MADAFANVVMLLVAAGVFAQGLSTIGFIQSLISIATSFGSASIILMLVLVILTMLAAVTTGSGNAPFYAFVEMIPKLAHSSGKSNPRIGRKGLCIVVQLSYSFKFLLNPIVAAFFQFEGEFRSGGLYDSTFI